MGIGRYGKRPAVFGVAHAAGGQRSLSETVHALCDMHGEVPKMFPLRYPFRSLTPHVARFTNPSYKAAHAAAKGEDHYVS